MRAGTTTVSVVCGKVEEMLDTGEDKLKNMPLRSALVKGGKEMQSVFGKRSRQLKASLILLLCASFCLVPDPHVAFRLTASRLTSNSSCT